MPLATLVLILMEHIFMEKNWLDILEFKQTLAPNLETQPTVP